MKILNKFKGFSSHRYNREPLEKLFAECWQEENTQLAVRNCTLDHLFSGNVDEHYVEIQSNENYKLAATLIQWLGSPVGQGFLAHVIEKAMNKNIPMPMFEPVSGCFGKSLTDPGRR
jgi:hypothetical protein